uniref:Uncharacterized protein n=1 Tax=Picea glauca TaxID=3330 RepID=A0A101M1J2_PICGL|nr:hypothetical protein ABT39_MTgene3734 [Picea glauca]
MHVWLPAIISHSSLVSPSPGQIRTGISLRKCKDNDAIPIARAGYTIREGRGYETEPTESTRERPLSLTPRHRPRSDNIPHWTSIPHRPQ